MVYKKNLRILKLLHSSEIITAFHSLKNLFIQGALLLP